MHKFLCVVFSLVVYVLGLETETGRGHRTDEEEEETQAEGIEESEGSQSEYVGESENDCESEEEMQHWDDSASALQPRGKKPAKRGRKDVISARTAVGKRKSGTDLREMYVPLLYPALRLFVLMHASCVT